jgi:hypothetical protein
MNKSKVYQNKDIIQNVDGSKIICCHPSITPNKLYTIYDEFDRRSHQIKFLFLKINWIDQNYVSKNISIIQNSKSS